MSDLPWYATFNSGFFLSLTTLLIGALVVSIRTCYKTKCSNFDCCFGLIKFKRDTESEELIDLKSSSGSEKYDHIPIVS